MNFKSVVITITTEEFFEPNNCILIYVITGLDNESSNALFIETRDKIEKFSNLIYYANYVTFFCLMLPTPIIMLYTLFSKGLESEDYSLPLYVW